MDVDESITMYDRLLRAVRSPEPHQPQNDAPGASASLTAAIMKALEAHGKSGTDPFTAAADQGCKVFVLSLPPSCNGDS